MLRDNPDGAKEYVKKWQQLREESEEREAR
jgi:hypothetical protein